MTRFAHVLKQTEIRLRAPEPTRTRILLEIAADLEDSYRHYLDQGLEETEAAQRAEEAFSTSDETLRLLERIHQTSLGSPTTRFFHRVGTVWSTVLLAFLFAFELLLAFRISLDRSFFVYPSPFLWPIGLLALAAIGFTLWKLTQIFSKQGQDVRRLRIGLGVPMLLAGASLAITFLGFLFHLQRYFRVNAEGAPETLFMNFAGWMATISTLMTIGLLTAILAGLVWFALSGLVIHREAHEMERLLQGSS
jgi:hypothetical protein